MAFEQSPSFSAPIAREQSYIQRVYQWMSLGLALTGFVALWASRSPATINMLWGGGFWLFFFVELGLVWWLSASIARISVQTAITGFLVYSAVNGLTLSYIFLLYTRASIASTFFVAAGTFAGASFFGWTTKKDLTSFASFFTMALIGFLLASLVNLFFQSPAFYWLLTYAGVLLFVGLTVFDVQQLKNIQRSGAGSVEQLAVLGALRLYLNFINMFLLLLRILGNRRR